MNIKYDAGDGRPVVTLSDDPGCLWQVVEQGPKGNVLITCTKRAPVTEPPVYSCDPYQRVDADVQFYHDNPGHSFKVQSMTGAQAYVMAFRTGEASSSPNSIVAQEYGGEVITKYMRISESPCDFSVPPGYSQVGSTTKLMFSVGVDIGFQVLKPNTLYYINLKNEDVVRAPGVSSSQGGACGFVLTFYR